MNKIIKNVIIKPMKLKHNSSPEEKKAYRWQSYDEMAKPKLLELIKYCQSNNRNVPRPYAWAKIYGNYVQFSDKHNFTEYPPLKMPLILGASTATNLEKRYRLLTQIYWCYKNMFIGSVYDIIMKTPAYDWEVGRYQEDKISLELIKKEYASWLGVKHHPEHNIWNHCTDHYSKQKQIQIAEEVYDERNHILDDESVTLIGAR